jgi:GT2 family glycosyltransferase
VSVTVVIVNYKTTHLTLRCIESVVNSCNDFDVNIVVVDNNSEDDPKNEILRNYPMVRWIQNINNVGFGRANNIGAAQCKTDYILFLNSDVVVFEDTISYSVRELKKNMDLGILGCKLLNEDGSLQKSTYTYIGDHMELLQYNILINRYCKSKGYLNIKAVMGAFLLIPTQIFEKVGGFDPDFFMYCEELDLCNRISKLDYSVIYYTGAIAIHSSGASSIGSNWSKKQTWLSRALLVFKVKGMFGMYLSIVILLLNTVTNFLLMWFLDKNYRNGFYRVQSFYYGNLFKIITIPFKYKRAPGHGRQYLKAS